LETKTFAELGLSPKVQAAITAAGYTTPTPIQAEAIPIAVTGRDVLGIAQTGTGKTASFVLPMITRLETGRARARMPRSLILAPTRELAAQCAQSFEKYGVNHKLDVALLIGGVSFDEQNKKLDRGVDVLIATPGRLLDQFQRGRVMLMGVSILVIDEADRMLDMGFIPDIEKICKLLPPKRQTLFFSATMPPEITRLVDQFLTDPVRVEVAKPATTANTITQRFRYCANGEDWAKRDALRELIRGEGVRNAIIFCNRKRDVAILLKSLTKHGFNAGALHGDMDQKNRMETLDKFRAGEIQLLAASDVAARGLDIPDVSHVFNFDLPWQSDDYVHRIGRTGRAGREGSATSLVAPEDLKSLKDIEKMLGKAVTWIGDSPTEEDYADAGKRRRGRGGGRPARGTRASEHRQGGHASHGDHPRRERQPHANSSRQGSGERRPERAPRESVASDPGRTEQPRIEQQRVEQPRSEPRSEQPRAEHPRSTASQRPPRPRRDEQQPPREPAAQPDARSSERHGEPRQKPRHPAPAAPRGDGGRVGFTADSVPAFMRKPARPKAANE
jgi:superfamily II DNA/RNA helicase